MLKKRIFKAVARMPVGYKLRIWLLRQCNYHVGKNVFIGEDIIIIDELTHLSTNLIIGDRVAIAPRVTLVLYTTPNWSMLADYVNSKRGEIVIEKDAWIGAGAVILPGLQIGEGAVVGANSVVTRDVPPYTVVAGVPAKEIKTVNVPWVSRNASFKG